MPANGSQYYQLLSPVQVGSQADLGPDYLAVHYAVVAIQKRINALGFIPAIPAHGFFDEQTDEGLRWAQAKLGLVADGEFGPKSSLAFFWPVVKTVTGPNAHTVGGIAQHESAWDPGAVGFSTPDDHGLVQINRPANPKITILQAFDPNFAFGYCSNRISIALATFKRLDIAICSYASPLWAQEWAATGQAPNVAMQAYADFVQSWVSPK